MPKWWDLDTILSGLKRLQRRFYFADYADEALRVQWQKHPVTAPYEEIVYPVVLPRDGIKSILVFKPDEIGDAVCSLPALRELRESFPEAWISLICQKSVAPIFERTGLFDEISPVKVKMRLLRFPSFSLREALRRFAGVKFDLAIFLRTYPSGFRAFRKIPSRYHLHPRDPRMASTSIFQAPVSLWGEKRLHQSLQMLEIVSLVTGRKYEFADVSFPPFQWREEDGNALALTFPQGIPPRFGVVHPFARYETRRYPLAYWRVLLGSLREQFGITWVVVGGKDDAEIGNLEGAVQMQGKLDLAQTGFLISKAAVFLGTDSGPAHLAGALGVPTISLRGGQSLATEWAPLGNSLVLRADVPCAPCHRRTCPGYGVKCLTTLTPGRVLPDIETFLARAFSLPVRPEENAVKEPPTLPV